MSEHSERQAELTLDEADSTLQAWFEQVRTAHPGAQKAYNGSQPTLTGTAGRLFIANFRDKPPYQKPSDAYQLLRCVEDPSASILLPENAEDVKIFNVEINVPFRMLHGHDLEHCPIQFRMTLFTAPFKYPSGKTVQKIHVHVEALKTSEEQAVRSAITDFRKRLNTGGGDALDRRRLGSFEGGDRKRR